MLDFWYFLLFILVRNVDFSLAIPIDNGVSGDPQIECGPDAIAINFNTLNNFEGKVYVKGRFAENDCRTEQIGQKVTGISLAFNACGTNRLRSLTPKGVFVTTTVIISFHPTFLTKVDRAYRIQCFYMEADKTVSQKLEVSMLTTGFQTEIVPMPICRYEILDGGPSGQPIKFTIVGQQVYHKWTCDTDTVETFCMVVHSCFVDDGQGDKVDLIDPNGCALDRYLLNNLEYPTDLMAGQEAHVFKYADRPQLFFQCQITITVKEPNSECERPQCSEPQRGKRQIARELTARDTLDVKYDVQTLDLSLDNERNSRMPPSGAPLSSQFCISSNSLVMGISILIVILASSSVVFVAFMLKSYDASA